MKYKVTAVRMRLDGCVLMKNISCEVNNLEGLRQFYKERYGAKSVMFTYDSNEV